MCVASGWVGFWCCDKGLPGLETSVVFLLSRQGCGQCAGPGRRTSSPSAAAASRQSPGSPGQGQEESSRALVVQSFGLGSVTHIPSSHIVGENPRVAVAWLHGEGPQSSCPWKETGATAWYSAVTCIPLGGPAGPIVLVWGPKRVLYAVRWWLPKPRPAVTNLHTFADLKPRSASSRVLEVRSQNGASG